MSTVQSAVGLLGTVIGGVSSSIAGASSRYMSSSYASGASPAHARSNGSGPQFDRDMDRMYHANIRPLLDVADSLRGILREETSIPVPSIVVVGDQSSGKSSVLEAICGVQLPRGREITTRCPLVLRLVNTMVDKQGNSIAAPARKAIEPGDGHQGSGPAGSDAPVRNSDGAYAIISIVSPSPQDGETIYDLSQVGPMVEAAQRKLAGHGVGVVAKPIYLSVFRPYSPDLTLIDLPGLCRVPIGDQPKDIYHQIKAMIMHYITPETAVILNVMPATVDFATCEAITMSKEVDPDLIRTIGVVTKPDLAENGILTKLQRGVEQLKLRLGVVAVRNRTHDENERGVSFEVARQMETLFFKNHKELSHLAMEFAERKAQHERDGPADIGGLYLGTNNLAQLLTLIQEQRIRTTLPKIKVKCRDVLNEYRAKYRELPSGHVATGGEARVKIEHLLNNTMQQLGALVRGEHSAARGDTKLHINPRLAELYTGMQQDLARTCSNFFSSEYAVLVEAEVKEQSGICLPNFQSAQVFKGLMHREIARLKQPATNLLDGTRQLVHHMLTSVVKSVFAVYPALLQRVQTQVGAFLDTRSSIILERLEEFLLQEEEIFTINSYYIDTAHKIKHAVNERLYAIQQTQLSHGGPQGKPQVPTTITIPINDLTVTIHLADLIKHAEKQAAHAAQQAQGKQGGGGAVPAPVPSASASVFGLQTLLNAQGASILDMQINAFAYVQVMHKRVCDALPLLLKFHLLRALTQSPATAQALSRHNATNSPVHMSLSALLQKEFIDLPDKVLLEAMKEEASVANRREQLSKSIERMEKAIAVFDAL